MKNLNDKEIESEVNHIFESGANEIRVVELIIRLLNSQQNTLTLDSKIKDGEPVEEPTDYKWWVLGLDYCKEKSGEWRNQCADYESLPTLRECLKELEELREKLERIKSGDAWKTLCSEYKTQLGEIEQLTKERDGLKISRDSWEKNYQKEISESMELRKQLQAEKSKNKELEEGIEISYKTLRGEITSGVGAEHLLKQLLTKQ